MPVFRLPLKGSAQPHGAVRELFRLVEVLRHYSNRSDLLHDLTRAVDRLQRAQPVPVEDQSEELSSACRQHRQDLLAMRFTSEQLAATWPVRCVRGSRAIEYARQLGDCLPVNGSALARYRR